MKNTRALRELSAAAGAIIEAAPDAMVVANRAGKIVLVNSLAERLFGYGPGELLDKVIEMLIPDRYRAMHSQYRDEYFKDPRTRPMGAAGVELVARRQDGSEFPAEISLSPLETTEGMLAITAIRDLSERRKAERARMRLAQAQEAVRIRDEFMSIASHELRTPLTALLLQLQGLQHALEGNSPVDRERILNRVVKAVRHTGRFAELVDALLDVSRIVSGKLTLKYEAMDLASQVRELVEDFREHALSAGCELKISGAPRVIGYWDRFRLEQVLINLLSNALKYGAGRPVEIHIESDGDWARVSVRDYGIGIAPADVDRIFGRFERAASVKHYGGLGLGLYIARHLVKAHAGRIRVISEPGQGATFVVELPVRASERPEAPAK